MRARRPVDADKKLRRIGRHRAHRSGGQATTQTLVVGRDQGHARGEMPHAALEVADDLRSKSERMANSSGFPWQPLSKHLHQTIDPQRIHGQEVALGVGFGAILVRSAYGRKMIRHNDHVRTRTEKSISLLQRQYDLMPNTRYDELDVYYEDD